MMPLRWARRPPCRPAARPGVCRPFCRRKVARSADTRAGGRRGCGQGSGSAQQAHGAGEVDTLDQLTTPRFTSSGGLTVKTWLVLARCVNSLALRSDIPHDQLCRITRRFGPQAPALDTGGDPLTRLSLLLAEAQSTLMWHAAGRRQNQTALAEALTLLEQLPQPKPPHAVIGLRPRCGSSQARCSDGSSEVRPVQLHGMLGDRKTPTHVGRTPRWYPVFPRVLDRPPRV